MKGFYSLLILLIITNSNLLSQIWEWVNPYPQGNTLYDISFGDELHGCAVGEKGTIIRTSDGGDLWQNRNLTPEITLRNCQFWNKDIGWISGDSGFFLKTTDAGITWLKKNLGLPSVNFPTEFKFIDEYTGFVWGLFGLLKSTDGGDSWFPVNSDIRISELAIVDELNFFAIGSDNSSIIKSTDGGYTWNDINANMKYLKNIYFVNDSVGWVCGTIHYGTNQFYTTNGGKSWEDFGFYSCPNVSNMYFKDNNNGFAISNYYLYCTTDGGRYWRNYKIFPSVIIRNFTFQDTSRIWCVGDYGAMLKSSDNKVSWIKIGAVDLSYFNDIFSVNFIDRNNGIATLNAGNYLVTNDGGIQWTEKNIVNKNITLLGSQFLDTTTGWIWGTSGSLYRTTNGGINWADLTINTNQKINQVFFFDNVEGWIIGDGIPLRLTVDGGDTWYEPVGGLLYWLNSIHFVNRKVGWAVGSVNKPQIIKTTDGGKTWSDITTTVDVLLSKVFFLDEKTGFVGGEGKLYKSTDGGTTWNQIMNINSIVKDFYFKDERYGWVLFNDLNGNGSGFCYTRDGGANWQTYPTSFMQKINGMYFFDFRNGWAVGQHGAILKYTDLISAVENKIEVKDDIYISPNPSSDYIEISYPPSEKRGPGGVSQVQIFDLLGMEVTTPSLRDTPPYQGGEIVRVDISGLAPGVYFIRVGDEVKKFIKI